MSILSPFLVKDLASKGASATRKPQKTTAWNATNTTAAVSFAVFEDEMNSVAFLPDPERLAIVSESSDPNGGVPISGSLKKQRHTVLVATPVSHTSGRMLALLKGDTILERTLKGIMTSAWAPRFRTTQTDNAPHGPQFRTTTTTTATQIQVKVMDSSFLALPSEVITRILLDVSIRDLLTCSLLNKYLHNIIQNTLILRYTIDAYFAGAQVLDGRDFDVLTETSLADRLDLLRKREAAWRSLRPDFRERINVPHIASGIYDLTGGIYLLGEAENGAHRSKTMALRYLTLPERMFEEATWERVDLGKQIVDVGLSAYEHDLIGIITSTPNRHEPSLISIELTLLQLSTSRHHPSAKQPVLPCLQAKLGSSRLAVGIEIVGRYLAVIICFHASILMNVESQIVDRFFVFDWVEGKLLIDHSAPAGGVYTSLTFLSSSVVLITNSFGPASFDIWDLSTSPASAFLGSLLLPPLRPHFLYRGLSARGEPNPYLSHSPQTKFQPNVFYDPQESIIVFNVHILLSNGMPWRTALVVAHRKALLEAADHLRAYEVPISSSSSPVSAPKVDYTTWGTKITRWIPAGTFSTRWITTSVGQRMVVSHDLARNLGGIPTEADRPSYLMIYDFNQNHLRKWFREENEMQGYGANPDEDKRQVVTWDENERHGDVDLNRLLRWPDGLDDGDDEDGMLGSDSEEGSDGNHEDTTGPVDGDMADMVASIGYLQIENEGLQGDDDDPLLPFTLQFIPQVLPPPATTSSLERTPSSQIPAGAPSPLPSASSLSTPHISLPTNTDPGSSNGTQPRNPDAPSSSQSHARKSDPSSPSAPSHSQSSQTRQDPKLTFITSADLIFAYSSGVTFSEPVTSELPFVVYAADCNPDDTSSGTYGLNGQYDGVLMDEERILGLKTNDRDHIVAIDVFHFG